MPLLLFVAGLAAGVLINVLADNLPPDKAGVRRPVRAPACRHCGQPHSGRFWLASISFLLRGGRCEHCQGQRGPRPVLVELASGLALPYVWLWASTGPGAQAAPGVVFVRLVGAALIVLSSILITVIDVEHRLILRIVVLPAALAVALIGALDPSRGAAKTLLGGLAGYGIMLGVFLMAEVYTRLQNRLRGRPLEDVAFGGGDVNLAALVGFAVGWPGVLLALAIAVVAAALFSLAIIIPQLLRRSYNPYTALPYGPFLVLGALLIYFYGKAIAQFWLAGG